MKRMKYVDSSGNEINQALENRRPLLNFFFVFGTIIPIIIFGIIIFKIFQNKKCIDIYDQIKKSSLSYISDQGIEPEVEGEDVLISIGDLYQGQYLKSSNTNNILCSGTVKVTKYKSEYVYTIDTKNCGSCSVNKKYSSWSNEINNYPKNKAIVDVIPYYNYYDRDISTTKWSDYYDLEELSEKKSEYGINLPIDLESLPEIPKEANIINIEEDTTYYYRYSNKSWQWYDIVGNYSDFSSEKPNGFEKKDENVMIYTNWSEYSLNYPEEKSYREISKTTGYKFYYINKSNKKIYFNNGKYTPVEDVNTDKYNEREEENITLYRYRDKKWRWYNGQRRNYSGFHSTAPSYRPYKDVETEILNNPSNWSIDRKESTEYLVEESKQVKRFRIEYETLSLLVLNKALNKKDFENKENTTIQEFFDREDKKLEVTYKFKYRKS